MDNYAHPWDALLQPVQAPTPQNDDVDAAMGFAPKPGDDQTTVFMKGLQSALYRNSPQGRDLTAEAAKAKLANQAAIQLLQAKMELAKQYPEYQAHPTPWGSVLMVNPHNPSDFQEVGGAAGGKSAYEAKIAAETAQNQMKADPNVIEAQKSQALLGPAKEQAQIDYYKDRGELDRSRAEAADLRAKLGGQKPWTTEDDQRVYNQIAMEMGFDPKNKLTSTMLLPGADGKIDPGMQARLDQFNQNVKNRIAQEKAERAAGKSSNGLVAPAPVQPQSVPNFSDSLMSPLSD